MSPAFYREVEKKTKLLREDYGGMMSIKDLMRELGFGSHHTVKNWVRENGVEGVRIGRWPLLAAGCCWALSPWWAVGAWTLSGVYKLVKNGF